MTTEEAKRELNYIRRNHDGSDIYRIESMVQPYRDVLLYRYVRAMTWKEVAEKMGYSQDHLRGYLKKRAIEKFAETE